MKLRPYRTFICWQYSRAHAKSTPILPAIRIMPHQARSNPVKPLPHHRHDSEPPLVSHPPTRKKPWNFFQGFSKGGRSGSNRRHSEPQSDALTNWTTSTIFDLSNLISQLRCKGSHFFLEYKNFSIKKYKINSFTLIYINYIVVPFGFTPYLYIIRPCFRKKWITFAYE